MKRHQTWNIEYHEYQTEQLAGLTDTQAGALAEHFTELSCRLAEAEFLLSSYENGWDVPNIENCYEDISE